MWEEKLRAREGFLWSGWEMGFPKVHVAPLPSVTKCDAKLAFHFYKRKATVRMDVCVLFCFLFVSLRISDSEQGVNKNLVHCCFTVKLIKNQKHSTEKATLEALCTVCV